jgi:Domain of unknown function (DUF3597)
MGLFKNLMNKIFHATAYAERAPDARPNTPAATATPAGGTQPAGAGAAAQGPVDIAAVLDGMAAANHEKLDWRHSIVDLMKLVGMDSSLAERKELAADLKYAGDTNDSATMNMWLHKEVMRKLAENGGKVPAELLAHEAAK